MSIRKITSLTLLVSFIPLVLTSVILFIVPEGRVAYWSDWRLWGLSKTQWGEIHINLGFLFLAAGCLHLFYNWKPIVAYLKNKAKDLKIFTPAFTIALALNLVFLFGTLWNIAPFSTIIAVSDYFKEEAAEKYGEPPYGHAELSPLALFARRTGLDLGEIRKQLDAAQIRYFDENQTVLEIAQENEMTPKAIYDLIKPQKDEEGGGGVEPFPAEPFPGMGRMVLADFCRRFDVDIEAVIEALAAASITAEPDQTLKEIGEANGMNPHAIFTHIERVAVTP
ncbi:MAG: DUF4405 domain-containing protein [Desulfopila sp.]|jgi:predicted DNA-binding protein YlxM (UPF0122 family)|nr:DUF4405 domain-containing protein [Desulfopila sp.]